MARETFARASRHAAADGNRAVTLRALGGMDGESERERIRVVGALAGVLGDHHGQVRALRDWQRADFDLKVQPT